MGQDGEVYRQGWVIHPAWETQKEVRNSRQVVRHKKQHHC